MDRLPADSASRAYVVSRRVGEASWRVVDRSGPTRVGRDAPQPRHTGDPWLAMFAAASKRQAYVNAHGGGRVFLAILHEQLDMFGLGG